MYERTCPICGTVFLTENIRRKYCDVCRVHPERKAKRMDANIHKSKIRCGDYDKSIRVHCNQCNKPITIPRGVPAFCTPACRMQYTMENRKCTYCGKNLYPEVKITREGGPAFHPGCEKLYSERRARLNGMYKICPVCREEYRASSRDQIYCGKECKRTADADPETYGKECRCLVCGKPMKIPYSSPKKPICSDACRNAPARISAERQKSIVSKSRAKNINAELEKREKENRENGLCGYCKTSYTKCPYVSSGFRTKPEGARYENFKIVQCPIFTDSRKPIK